MGDIHGHFANSRACFIDSPISASSDAFVLVIPKNC